MQTFFKLFLHCVALHLHFVKELAAYQFQRLHNPESVQLEPAPRTMRTGRGENQQNKRMRKARLTALAAAAAASGEILAAWAAAYAASMPSTAS